MQLDVLPWAQVESSLREVPGVLRSEAWLEDGGRARVQCSVSETEATDSPKKRQRRSDTLRQGSMVLTL